MIKLGRAAKLMAQLRETGQLESKISKAAQRKLQKAKIQEQKRLYRQKHKAKIRQYQKKWRKQRPDETPKERAQRLFQGGEFLTVGSLDWPDLCPVFGKPLDYSGKDGQWKWNLDRLDPTKGYTPDNTRIISIRANRLKSDASLAELERLYEWLLDEIG